MITTPVETQRPEPEVPGNLHVSVGCPECALPPLRERVEQKFFITPSQAGTALALLRRTCRPDPEFPDGQVNSLYFDTFDLNEHERSQSGEFCKDKVRIRWYGDECNPHRACAGTSREGTISVWIELKSRRGFASTKQRAQANVEVSMLAHSRLHKGIIPDSLLTQTMACFGFLGRGHLRPVITISYARHRFVEPRTGFRISIDSHIRSSMIMTGIGIGERALELPGMVVEVKGSRFELPRALRPFLEFGSSWTRFSKYSSSLDAHAEAFGCVSRLWPNGMIEKRPGVLARVVQTEGGFDPALPSSVN
jgi:hypothetical protein